ncbi:MAG: hypothetical protein INR64_11735 [Caulobacteraceae bacterium]|nr:hypothetical protein [Caulobacter sp.]
MRSLLAAALFAAASLPAAQPGVEVWKPLSSTAQITGTIHLSPTRLTTANGAALPLAVAADTPAFETDTGTYPARILRVTRPANPVLSPRNRFCTAPVRWIVVWREKVVQEGSLGMAVFSSPQRPTGEGSPGLCGTFGYVR